MNRIYKNKEWDFIVHEMKSNKPDKPIQGKELVKRELLLLLRQLLVNYTSEVKSSAKITKKQIYTKTKELYLCM